MSNSMEGSSTRSSSSQTSRVWEFSRRPADSTTGDLALPVWPARRRTARIRANSSSGPKGVGGKEWAPRSGSPRGPRRQHDYRNGAAAPDLSQQLEAVQHRQHHVQDDQIKARLESAGEAAAAVVDRLQRKPVLREEILHQRAQLTVIV